MSSCRAVCDATRRRFCRRGLILAGAGLALPAGAWIPGCAGPSREDEPIETRVLLALIPRDGRIGADHAGVPVEIQRQGDGFLVRSLLCTHQGCRLRWEADSSTYHCPCHDGRFDEHGRPIQGPPRRDLRVFPTRIEGDELVIEPDSTRGGSA